MDMPAKPKVLVVYYTFSKQTERVADVIGDDARGPRRRRDQGAHRVHRQALGEAVREDPDALPDAQDRGHAPGPDPAGDGRDPHPARGAGGRLRPRRHRLADLVVPGEPADPLVSQVARGPDGARRQAVRRVSPPRAATGSTTSGTSRRFGEAAGGTWIDETHFVAVGNQVQSMLSWLSLHVRLHRTSTSCCACRRPTSSPDSRRRRSDSPRRSPIRPSVQPTGAA